uniref:Neur_chan_LBD domain-containing protein n=1 Tax=Caenorhabditis tropicalis TaxID=1561998 RepID=A0A1I7UUT7_9PELO
MGREQIPLGQMPNSSRRSTEFNDNASNSSIHSRRPTINFQELLEDLPEPDRETGERLRRHLQFFFMNPMEKWKVRRQLPYKLVLQVLKIIFVTMQLILFAEMRMSHVDFVEDTTTVMRHRFLKEWNDDRDALQYPPAEGRYSVYDDQGLNEHLSFLINSYYSIQNDSFASFSYDVSSHPTENPLGAQIIFHSIPPIEVLIDRISNVSANNNTYDFDIREVKETKRLNLTESEVFQIGQSDDSVRDILATRGITFLPEDALKISTVTFRFRLRTIHYSPTAGDQKPECYKIAVSIKFDNSRHTGQVHVTLATVVSYVNVCNGRIIKGVGWSFDTLLIGGTDIFVLILCILSLILCCRALIKAHLLQVKTSDYFENVLKNPITVTDQLDFLNMWYVMIVVNDVLIILGTIAKISIEFQVCFALKIWFYREFYGKSEEKNSFHR